jgi:class 3 adenylate cyclase/tetratricopeptide (TPR) repeat protein
MSDWPAADRELPDSSQRRHLTVMFCDVVGATHLSGERDVETYFSILHAYYGECRPVVERHGGRIAQHQGDGIYVWFGYPVPKDDDAICAVRAALDLLVVLRRLSSRLEVEIGEPLAVRIAIHAGEVLVAPVAGEVAPLAFGHTPNLAAKLQHAARPGTLVISDEVLRLVADCFEVQAGPPAILADGSVVPVHEVVKEKHRQGRVGRSWRTPMVDRNRERARLQGIWTSVQAGDGAVIGLVGGRGIGKTRLASTVLAWAGTAEAKVLDCACNHLDTTTAYHACRTLLTQAAGIEPDDPPTVTAALLQDHLDGLGMDKRAATLLATVLGLPPETVGPTPDLTPSKLAELTTACLVEWVRRVASTPTVLLVDDVTDADPSSLGVLARLAAAPPPRLLLVLTARSDVAPPPFLAADTIEIIEVTPLPSQICETLVDAVTAKSPLEQRQRQQVLAQGEGIPLFLEELARSAQEGLHRPGLPITLTGHLQARLAAPGIDREVAGALAVADRDLDESILASVLGADPQQLRARLSGLLASDLVIDTGGPRSRYRFRHGLITEAAYGLLLREHRSRLHSRLAEALARPHAPGHSTDWSVVGKHLKLAGRPLDAFEAILTGANEASRTGAFQEALQGYRDALDVIADVKDAGTRDILEMRCLPLKGGAASIASGYTSEEAVKDFNRCAALCRRLGSRPEHLSAIIGPLSFYLTRGELAAARRVAEDLRCWVDTGNTYHRAESAAIFGALSFFEGDYQGAGELFDLAVEEFSSRPTNDRAEQNWFLPHDIAVAALAHQAALCRFAGQHRVAQNAGERAIARASTLGFPLGPYSMAYAKSYLGWANAIIGNHRIAAKFACDVRDIGQRHGFHHWESNGKTHLAIAQYRISGRADAADAVEQHASVWGLIGVRVFLPYFLTVAADTRAAMGQHAEALAGFAAAGRLADETGVYFYEAERLRLLARVLPPSGEKPAATLYRAWELAHRQGALLFELRSALDLARLGADPGWAQRLDATVRRFLPGAVCTELREAQALLARAP